MPRRYFAILSVLIALTFGMAARAQDMPLDAAEDAKFTQWVEQFKARAVAQGVSQRVVDEAFTGLTLDTEVIALDRKQPENKVTLARYLHNTISNRRIEKGRQMLADHADALAAISKQYGVQPQYIVALWAIESDYGDHKGDFSVVQSLATLAYEGRRAEFFSNELIDALKILDAEHLHSDELTGSWAGAMGDCQFMPSTYLNYAVDASGDGKRDIWNNPADVFASIANYLHSLGWNPQENWGRAVTLPKKYHLRSDSIKHGHSGNFWRKQGLVYVGGGHPDGPTNLYAIYAGTPGEQAYLITDNYKALLQWNRSRYFATAVGTLADAIGE